MAKKIFTLAELAEYTKSRLVGNPELCITNVADLESAGAEDASFLANPLYEKTMRSSRAGVVFVSPNVALDAARNYLVTDNPSRSFQQTVEAFVGEALHCISGFKGIHPTAVIHESAVLGRGVTVGPCAVIDKGALRSAGKRDPEQKAARVASMALYQ